MDPLLKKIQFLDPASLLPSRRDVRAHSRKQILEIKAALARFGFGNPIVIQSDLQVVAGSGRVKAAALLGLTKVPVLLHDEISQTEMRDYILAEYRYADRVGFDKEIPAMELRGIIEQQFESWVKKLNRGSIEPNPANSSKAETAALEALWRSPDFLETKPVTRFGDVWALGAHRLVCGDSCDRASYARLFVLDQTARLVLGDLPSEPFDQATPSRVTETATDLASISALPPSPKAFYRAVFKQLHRHSGDGSLHFLGVDWRHILESRSAALAYYSELKGMAVCRRGDKVSAVFSEYGQDFVFAWKKGIASGFAVPEFTFDDVRDEGIQQADISSSPRGKPVAFWSKIISNCSNRGDIVLVPFGGDCAVLPACDRLNRRARIIEMDPLKVDEAIRKWSAYTKRSARLIGADELFEDREQQ